MTTVVESAPEWLLDPTVPVGEVRAYLETLEPVYRTGVLAWLQSHVDWASSPLAIGKALDPGMVVTPALELIDREFVRTVNSPPPASGGHRIQIVVLPPQEGKTTLVTQRGTEYLLRRDRNTKVGLVSYDAENVRRVSLAIRSDAEYFDGTEGNADLGLRLRRGDKAASRWSLANGRGGVYAIGVTGGFTGRPVDALIIDDPVKDYRSADSSLQSDQVWVWWLTVGRPRLAPGAPVFLVLTRWSDLDLAGRLIAQYEKAGEFHDEVSVLRIPAQADHEPAKGEVDPLGRAPGQWLESARKRTDAQWEATKAATLEGGGSREWSALYQGRPAPKEGGEIKRHWFKIETQRPADEAVTEWLASWDMKLKENESGDYVVGGMWARVLNHYWLLDVFRGQWDFPTVQCAIALMAVRYPHCQRHVIENTGNGPEVMKALRKPQPDFEMSKAVAGELASRCRMTPEERKLVNTLRRRGLSGLVPENPKGSKRARMRAVTGPIESGHVHVMGEPWTAEYIGELASFGVGGAYDDQVDMTSQALRRL